MGASIWDLGGGPLGRARRPTLALGSFGAHAHAPRAPATTQRCHARLVATMADLLPAASCVLPAAGAATPPWPAGASTAGARPSAPQPPPSPEDAAPQNRATLFSLAEGRGLATRGGQVHSKIRRSTKPGTRGAPGGCYGPLVKRRSRVLRRRMRQAALDKPCLHDGQ